MLKTIIVDDEQSHIDDLYEKLRKEWGNDIEVIDKCTNTEDALMSLKKNEPDLVFLDIQFKNSKLNGFDLLKILYPISFDVIFFSSYDEFALKAFEYFPITYIIKPPNIEKLAEAINKVKERRQNQWPVVNIPPIWEEMIGLPVYGEKGRVEFLRHNVIVYCLSNGKNETVIYYNENERIDLINTTRTISNLIDTLPEHLFFQINQGIIISKMGLKTLNYEGTTAYVFMKNSLKFQVARRRLKKFKDWLGL